MERDDLKRTVRRLVDRQEIEDCIRRYARGVDRLDRELWLSVYHDDAFDNRSPIGTTPREFADWYWPRQAEGSSSQHYLTNMTIEIDDDTAHAETYFLAVIRIVGSENVTLSTGRYIDRLERRDGEWRVAVRILARESRLEAAVTEDPASRHPLIRRDRSDPSYERPLLPSDSATHISR